MILPDVNQLIYAFRRDTPKHRLCREWLDSVVNGDSAYAISPQGLSSVVRVCPHPAIFPNPSQLRQALAFCRILMNQPHCQLVHPGARHWSIFAGLCEHVRAAGNLVQGAWFAALAIAHGCDGVTADRDYARFPGLAWHTPF